MFLITHRVTEWYGLEGTSVGHLVHPPCRSTYSRLHRTLSRRVLNISREGDSTTSLGSLFQCSINNMKNYTVCILRVHPKEGSRKMCVFLHRQGFLYHFQRNPLIFPTCVPHVLSPPQRKLQQHSAGEASSPSLRPSCGGRERLDPLFSPTLKPAKPERPCPLCGQARSIPAGAES